MCICVNFLSLSRSRVVGRHKQTTEPPRCFCCTFSHNPYQESPYRIGRLLGQVRDSGIHTAHIYHPAYLIDHFVYATNSSFSLLLNNSQSTSRRHSNTTQEHHRQYIKMSPIELTGHVLLFSLVLGMSATVDISCMIKQLRNIKALMNGLFMQFVVLPFLGFCSVKWFGLGSGVGLMLLVVTSSPGGSFSNW